MINAALLAFSDLFAPGSQVNLTAAASAATAVQGQFSTVDAVTPIVVPTLATVTVRTVLRPTPINLFGSLGSADTSSVLKIVVNQGDPAQTVVSIAVTTGTLLYQRVANQYGEFWIQPGAGGVVNAAITLSAGNNNTRVTLNHRTFVASATVDTLP